jgi:hypothetical protein
LGWDGEGGHGKEQTGPDLTGEDAGTQHVVRGLIQLVAEGTVALG